MQLLIGQSCRSYKLLIHMNEVNSSKSRKDLSNQVFGFLKAIEPGPNKDGKTTWLCRCEACGSEKFVKTKDLTRGKATSCGCKWKKRGVEQMQYVDGTCIEMLKSTKVRSNNTTGHTGVYYDAKKDNYRVEITLQGKRHYLGRYKSLDEAVKVRERAKEEYHERFIESHTVENDDISNANTQ